MAPPGVDMIGFEPVSHAPHMVLVDRETSRPIPRDRGRGPRRPLLGQPHPDAHAPVAAGPVLNGEIYLEAVVVPANLRQVPPRVHHRLQMQRPWSEGLTTAPGLRVGSVTRFEPTDRSR